MVSQRIVLQIKRVVRGHGHFWQIKPGASMGIPVLFTAGIRAIGIRSILFTKIHIIFIRMLI